MQLDEFLQDKKSYGLNNLDIKMKKHLGFANGVYVEAGANDGLAQSNTKIFSEYLGWTGLLVEPDYNTYLKCKSNRPESIVVHGALVSFDYKQKYVTGDFDGSLTASVKGIRQNRYFKNDRSLNCLNRIINMVKYRLTKVRSRVPAYTLDYLLQSNNISKVNFLSLDVEGYELEVLEGIDFNRVSPDYILCEIYSDKYDAVCGFLKKNGYLMIENLSNYNRSDFPDWDGSHNDYLFKKLI
jgi:FkbM family methyltransferase